MNINNTKWLFSKIVADCSVNLHLLHKKLLYTGTFNKNASIHQYNSIPLYHMKSSVYFDCELGF